MEPRIADELYMMRALELAACGLGTVSPNPMVGCVIVCNERIIGEGWHRKWGEAHAEVNAVNSVEDKRFLSESTVYVTLEPCSHFGKTPPCADLLIREKVKKVVIANTDPNPLVAGEGIRKLKNAGIEVSLGTLENQAHELNKRFFTFMEKKRPYIILKWAQTSDGFIAREDFDSKWISNEISRQLVHKWRSEEDAILVGANTVRYDDPVLNVRAWSGRNPVRVILDSSLKLPQHLHVFDGLQPTIVYNRLKNQSSSNLEYVKAEGDLLRFLMADLYSRKIQSLIIEGGAQTLKAFLEADLWDEARIFQSSSVFQKGIAAPEIDGVIVSESKIQNDILKVIRRHS